MDRGDLQSLLEELKSCFDYEKFRDSKKPVQTWDSFWVDTFHRCYVEDNEKGRDDLLFYVTLDSKQDSETVEVLRRDSKSLPKRTDHNVLWEQTLYLNVLLHEFSYHVTSAVLTVKPNSDSVDEVMTKAMQRVYPSPIERRMDSKGKVAQVAYPNIVFCIDNFEDIFGDIFTSKRGQKVAVQLLATNGRAHSEQMVFLGAIDHVTLMDTVEEKEQVSLGTKLKKQLSLKSKSGKVYDTQTSYHFIQMKGPKSKGFAEMAVIRRNASYLEQPGTFTYSVDSPNDSSSSHSKTLDSHSDMSHSNSNTPHEQSSPQPDMGRISQTSNANGEPRRHSLNVTGGGVSHQGGSTLGGKYSPELRKAFLGQSSAATMSTQREREEGQMSPSQLSPSISFTSRGSCSSQTCLLRSQSLTPEEEGSKDTRYVMSPDGDEKGDVFSHVGRGQPTKHKDSKSSKSMKLKPRESMKDLFLSFGKGSKKERKS